MATIKKKFIGDKQFGGFTPYGNVTTIRATGFARQQWRAWVETILHGHLGR